MKVLVVAAEESASIHALGIIRHLRKMGNYSFWGVGSSILDEVMDVVIPSEELSFVGFEEPLRVARIVRAYLTLKRLARESDALLLFDYPGMNLRLASYAKGLGKRVCYYIAPQVWAWGRWRIRKIKKAVDALACLFPFEEPFFRSYGVNARFFGHPLVDRLLPYRSSERRWLLLLPGSRNSEVASLLPVMVEAAEPFHKRGIPVALVRAQSVSESLYSAPPWVEVVSFEERYTVMGEGLVAVAASGTATLELALLEVPTVVVYRVSPLSWFLGRRLVKVDFLSIVNILLGREVFPELLQDRCVPGAVAEAIGCLLNPKVRRGIVESVSALETLLKGERPYMRAAEFFHEVISEAS